MEYKVTEKDLIGDIKDFPIEVVQRMVDCQLEQDNKACIDVLQGEKAGGFDWRKTKEGLDFWHKVIEHKNFNLFFQKYPKQNQLTIQKDMETNKLILNGITLPKGTEAKVSVEDGTTIITFSKQESESKEPKFKDGDIAFIEESDGGYIAIVQFVLDDIIEIHAVLHLKTGLIYTNLNGKEILIRKNILSIRYATEEEMQELFNGLANQKHLSWNAEELKFEPIRWRAEKGGKFWFITSNGIVDYAIDNYNQIGDLWFNSRNYFQTEELANKAQPLWKDFFKSLSL